tara:strand:+ start:5675 stop:6265 length:591 start_codon:yes stop_codon:yes gene_type:complete
MKKTLLALAISVTGMSAAHAHPHDFKAYSELRGSIGQYSVDTVIEELDGTVLDSASGKTAPAGGIALRHHYNERFASEVEFTIAGDAEAFGRDSVSINTAVTASALVKADKYNGFLPYAKLGYGLFDTTLHYDGDSVEDRHGTYVAGLGVDYDLSKTAIIGVQYEHFGEFDIEYSADGNQQSIDLNRLSLNVGFRF